MASSPQQTMQRTKVSLPVPTDCVPEFLHIPCESHCCGYPVLGQQGVSKEELVDVQIWGFLGAKMNSWQKQLYENSKPHEPRRIANADLFAQQGQAHQDLSVTF